MNLLGFVYYGAFLSPNPGGDISLSQKKNILYGVYE